MVQKELFPRFPDFKKMSKLNLYIENYCQRLKMQCINWSIHGTTIIIQVLHLKNGHPKNQLVQVSKNLLKLTVEMPVDTYRYVPLQVYQVTIRPSDLLV